MNVSTSSATLPPLIDRVGCTDTADSMTTSCCLAGGLLNATFGNVVELILSIIALIKGLYDLVAYSLIGSVLSNLLLVLGENSGSLLSTLTSSTYSQSCHARMNLPEVAVLIYRQWSLIWPQVACACRACY